MNIMGQRISEVVNLKSQEEHAQSEFERYKLLEDTIRKSDFPGRVYVSSSLKIFEERKRWENEIKRINERTKKY